MVPRFYQVATELPRLPHGKVDVRRVCERSDGVVDMQARLAAIRA